MQQSIEINTVQNVTIEYDLASMWERMLAWIIDALIVSLGYLILIRLAVFIFQSIWERGWSIFWVVMSFVVYFMYNIFMEILNGGQTLGKMIMSTRVVRLDGNEPEWSDVVLRAILQMLDSLFSFGIIGLLLIQTTPKSQRLGDMAANTTVIKIQQSSWRFRLEDILGISTIQNYQPLYPEVRNLSEKDMIYIKNVIARQKRFNNEAHREVVEDLVTHLMQVLQIDKRPPNSLDFLKILLKDYIVLTR